jgi:hypothetical protein
MQLDPQSLVLAVCQTPADRGACGGRETQEAAGRETRKAFRPNALRALTGIRISARP